MIRIRSNSFGWIADASGESLTIRTNRAREIAETLNGEYAVEIKKHSKGRSNQQNSMYWSILGQIAGVLGVSNPRFHNLMIRRYGIPWIVGGQVATTALPDTDEVENEVAEDEHTHLKPTSEITFDGRRVYHIMKGSSQMSVEEMKRLIDGLMDEARNLGITLIWEE